MHSRLGVVILFPLASFSAGYCVRAQEPRFLRADSNGDGAVELSDAAFTLNFLFLDGPAVLCQDAADSNDDGALDISDPVHQLLFLFAGGAAPPAPFPGCGVDPTGDALGCATQPHSCIPVDSDLDGLFDDEEALLGTNPQVADTDGDGLGDGAEVKTHLTRPLDSDSDDDDLSDGAEVNLHHTLPLDPDTDNDGYGDGAEFASGTDPLNSASFPSTFPPDPVLVAPEIEAGVASSIYASTLFLYRGTPPIQTGVADGVIDPKWVAVLRGKVMNQDEEPISGVTITILSHPEYGETRTRADGFFDLVVNGGAPLVVRYERAGFLSAQRQIDVPWLDYRTHPDVILIQLDGATTRVNLAGPAQVARGSQVADADGSRRPTVFIPQGTSAQMVMPNGTQVPLTNLTIRATEYTVGEKGPEAMPATLPSTSGYTHCVELTADEAMTAGAKDVTFSSPLPYYVENFLDLSVGTEVPLGSYDRSRGVWIPSPNGKVIKVLGITGALADLDVTGDGVADTGAALSALSITNAEREKLATLYSPGQSLWRALIPHFSPWDLNMPIVPPDDAELPDQDPEPDEPLDEPCEQSGNSVIECQNQILGEEIAVVGTGFSLHYQSDRTYGYLALNTVEIPLAGEVIPGTVLEIRLEIEVAGRMFKGHFPPQPNQRISFTWDGMDAYRRRLEGPQPITARIGFTYEGVYGRSSRFGLPGNGVVTSGAGGPTVVGRMVVTLWRTWNGWIGGWRAPSSGLGTGWSLSPHHGYLPATRVLYRGDGRREGPGTLGPIISTVAGGPGAGPSGDGGPATAARFIQPRCLAIGPDGSMYIGDTIELTIRRVGPDGIINRLTGGGSCVPPGAPCGNGGPALQASFVNFGGLAVAPDHTLYISEPGSLRIRKIVPDGIITTIAGNGVRGFSGDGGPALQATLDQPQCLAVGPDNAVYFTDGPRVRRVGPDGIIDTVAGGGSCVPAPTCGDGGPAVLASIGPRGIAVGRDGSLYIADSARVRLRQVTPDGIIRTIAGTGASGFSGDGGPATQATFRALTGVAVGADDTVYVVDSGDLRIRYFRPGGIINTLAGSGVGVTSGDGGPAASASVNGLDFAIAVGPDGGVYFSQTGNTASIRRVTPIDERFVGSELAIPAKNGTEVYMVTLDGRHLRTIDALTGSLRHQFAYDGAGLLSSITDVNGNVTTIERDGQGRPLAIIGPFGHGTELELDGQGSLARVTNPAGESTEMRYRGTGLLSSFTRAGGQESRYQYDNRGRLTAATDPTGATRKLERTGTTRDYTVTMTSPLGLSTTYTVNRLPNNDQRMTTTDPAGVETQALIGRGGRDSATLPDGTRVDQLLAPDPRWGMRAPIAASLTVTTPGGKVLTTTIQRAVTLSNPNDPLSLQTWNETVTINGRGATATYDATTRSLTFATPGGLRYTAATDDRGRLSGEQSGDLEPRSFNYDALGRLGTTTLGEGAGGRLTSFFYGVGGFLSNITDPINRTTAFTTDGIGRVTEQTFPDGSQVLFTHDLNGNINAITPPERPDHTFQYTARDEVSSYTAPAIGVENRQTRFSYDSDRRLAQIDHPDGQVVGLQYDDGGRIGLIDLPSGDLSYGYDDAGRVITLSSPSISLAYTYDSGLRTGTTWSGAVAGSVVRTYDNDFKVSALSVNGGNPVTIEYDSDGQMSRVGSLVLTRAAQTGLILTTTLGSSTEAMSYDGFGAPAAFTARQAGSVVFSEEYSRDSVGRLTTRTETTGGVTRVFSYSYDLAGALVEVRVDGALGAGYTHDAHGNRLSRVDPAGSIEAAHDVQDRLIQSGASTYNYTPIGQLRSRTAGGQTSTYRYDGLGNLTSVTLAGGTQIDYLHDGQSRRVAKWINGTLTQGFLYQDGMSPIAELDGSGNLVTRFVYATRRNIPDYMIRGGVTYRIISDHGGSPRVVFRVDTGEVLQRINYDEFGRILGDTNPGFQPFGFVGGIQDRDTNLVRRGVRDYDPEIGRWTTKEPFLFRGRDTNLYRYSFGDPVNFWDLNGLEPERAISHPLGVGRNELWLENDLPYFQNAMRHEWDENISTAIVRSHFVGLTFKKFDRVRLSSCNSPEVYAQRVANELGVLPVVYANQSVHLFPDGTTLSNKCSDGSCDQDIDWHTVKPK